MVFEFIYLFLHRKTAYLEWFLKDRDTEQWSNDAENSALPSKKNKLNIGLHLIFFLIKYI